jgi:GNAT superfamily N-acetyltransferase
MDVSIRLARVDDVPRLLELYTLLDVAPRPAMPIEAARAWFVKITANPLHGIYVAVAGARIVGTFALIFINGLPHGARDSCIVEDVVVEAELQGGGIGRQMMRFAMDLCAEHDCYKMVLSSHLKRAEAHSFYDGLGFRKHGYSFLIEFSRDIAGVS